MTLVELRDKADAKLATFWSALVTKQNAYHAKHGKFFQLLVSPENAVVDGVDSDFTLRHPSDEKFVVDVDFAWTEKIPFQIQVDVCECGKTSAFTAKVFVRLLNGDIYTRSRRYELLPDLVDRSDPENPINIQQDPVQIDSGWMKYDEVDQVTNIEVTE